MHQKISAWFLIFAIIITSSLCWTAKAGAQADFYKGKTITVYVGTTPGALYDQWSRLLAQYMGRHIPGKPESIVQNMPGAGHKIAANYVYTKTKPDGLSLIGSIVPTLYFDQLVGRPEIQFDWGKFVWIGAPVQGESQMYMRADTPYKTIDDVRNAKEAPRCGAQGTSRRITCRDFSRNLSALNSIWCKVTPAGRKSTSPSSAEKFIAAPSPSKLSYRGSPTIRGVKRALCATSFKPARSATANYPRLRPSGSSWISIRRRNRVVVLPA